MPLTDTAIKKAKPGPKPIKLSDQRGLYLLVTEKGSKLWRWKYRIGGKEKVMALGAYQDVSLAEARDAMSAARKLLVSGDDPMVIRKSNKQARKASAENSFAAVSRLWWNHWKVSRSPRHADYVIRRLEGDIIPAIGAMPARSDPLKNCDTNPIGSEPATTSVVYRDSGAILGWFRLCHQSITSREPQTSPDQLPCP